MISKKAVEEQLKRIGCNFRFWNRAEINELGRIMLDDEIIAECANGEYGNGFALLVATNHRVLLVDKKPMMYLTVEDLRYDMITEFNYSHRLMNCTIRIHTTNKTLQFSSWNQARLRRLLEYTQQRVLEMRQQAHMAQQFQAAAAAQYAQLHAANYYQVGGTPSYAPNLAQQQSVQPVPPVQNQQPLSPQQQYESSAAAAQASAQPATPSAAPVMQSQPQPQPEPQARKVEEAPVGHSFQPHSLVTRFAAKRAALGTYTRNKLPSFRRHNDHEDNRTPAQSGELYPKGYNPGNPVTDYGLPYQY